MEATTQNTKQMTAIERALAAAKARKAMRDEAGLTEEPAPAPTAAAPKPGKETKSPDPVKAAAKAEKAAQRAAAVAELRAARDARRAEREAKKAAKAAAASRGPAHMKKVERARAKCPPLSAEAEAIFGEITANFGAQQIDAIAQHLLVHNRAAATQLATSSPRLPLGALVTITGGDPRYVGMTGRVVHSQALRAKVEVAGVARPVYIYNGQAQRAEEAAPVAAAG